MRKPLTTILLAAMAAAGCQQGGTTGNQAAAAPKVEPAANLAAAVPANAAVPPSDCAPAPKLALAADFADPRKTFAPDAPAFRQTAAHFDAAYRKACATGVLRGHSLIEQGATHPDTLFLKNAPDANVAAIYRDGENGPTAQRVMVLEYFFLPSGGASHVPTADELSEAIFCAARGASAKAQQEDGRCLVD
jgi:hypothetical protein